MEGSFDDFLDALLAFESGWDRERYDAGIIVDAQLNTWAGGTVQEFFPEYSSWGDLTDEEWETMAYRSTNSFGFVGYQFGEALLIDLGYYDDDVYYGNGASTNTWDGTWTGKNGVDFLEEFMTKEAQDVAIVEEFGFNLEHIEEGLNAAGKSLDDYIGTTVTYNSGGTVKTVEITLTGIAAAAHLRGYPATIDLLLNGTLSADEYGTSILQYMDQFGGYDSPDAEELIAYFEDRLTGDEGLGGSADNGSAGVTGDTADVVIDWAWGTHDVVTDFDPATDTIYVGWFTSDQIDIAESDGNVVISVPANNQTTTLEGVTLAALSAANFTILDDSAAGEILALVGSDDGTGGDVADGGDDTGDTGTGGDTGTDTGDTGTDTGTDTGSDSADSGNGTADVTAATATVAVDWSWGTHDVVRDFDPDTDTIYVGWFTSDQIDISERNGSVVISVPSNHQTTTLQGVSLSDLSDSNFTIKDDGAAQEILALVGQDGSSGDGTGDTGGAGSGTGDTSSDPDTGNGVTDTVHMTWNWGAQEVVSDFSPSEDVLDFGTLPAGGVTLSETDGDLYIEVNGNGGHTYVIENVQAEDLTLENLAAAGWNDAVLDGNDGVIEQLAVLGNDHIA